MHVPHHVLIIFLCIAIAVAVTNGFIFAIAHASSQDPKKVIKKLLSALGEMFSGAYFSILFLSKIRRWDKIDECNYVIDVIRRPKTKCPCGANAVLRVLSSENLWVSMAGCVSCIRMVITNKIRHFKGTYSIEYTKTHPMRVSKETFQILNISEGDREKYGI